MFVKVIGLAMIVILGIFIWSFAKRVEDAAKGEH